MESDTPGVIGRRPLCVLTISGRSRVDVGPLSPDEQEIRRAVAIGTKVARMANIIPCDAYLRSQRVHRLARIVEGGVLLGALDDLGLLLSGLGLVFHGVLL